jgi:hypothetical protein
MLFNTLACVLHVPIARLFSSLYGSNICLLVWATPYIETYANNICLTQLNHRLLSVGK